MNEEKLTNADSEGELSEDALEDVAGGFLLLWTAAPVSDKIF